MPNVGNVYVDFTAQTAQFTGGVERVNAKLDEFGKKASESKDAGADMFSAVAGGELLAAGIEKVGEMAIEAAHAVLEFESQLAEADEKASRLAKAVGLDVGSLQALQAAAKVELGMDPEALGRGMEHLSSAIGEAAKQAGPARDAFEAIGLDAEKLSESKADEQLYSVLDALAGIQNVSQRMQLAKDIMGEREFREFAPIIGQGADALRKASQHARELGVALSDADAGSVEGMNKSFKELGETVDGIGQQFLAAIAPLAEEATRLVTAVLPSGPRLREIFDGIEGAAEAALYPVKAVLEAVGLMSDSTADNAGKTAEATDQTKQLTASQTELAKKLKDVERARELSLRTMGQSGAVEEVQKLTAEYTKAGEVIPDEITKIIAHVNELGEIEGIEKMRKELEKAINVFGETEGQKRVQEIWKQFGDAPDAMRPAVIELIEMAKYLDYIGERKSITGILDQLHDQAQGADEAARALEKLRKEHATQADMDLASSFIDQAAYRKVTETLDEMGEKASRLTEQQREIDKLRKAGGSDDDIKWAEEIQKRAKANEEFSRSVEQIKKMAEESLSPLEKAEKELSAITAARRAGAVTDLEAAAARKRVNEEYAKSISAEHELAGAMVRRFDRTVAVMGSPGDLKEKPARSDRGFIVPNIELPPLQMDRDDKQTASDIRDNTAKLVTAFTDAAGNLAVADF